MTGELSGATTYLHGSSSFSSSSSAFFEDENDLHWSLPCRDARSITPAPLICFARGEPTRTPLPGSRFGFLLQGCQECEHVDHLLLSHGVGQILRHKRQATALARKDLRGFEA